MAATSSAMHRQSTWVTFSTPVLQWDGNVGEPGFLERDGLGRALGIQGTA